MCAELADPGSSRRIKRRSRNQQCSDAAPSAVPRECRRIWAVAEEARHSMDPAAACESSRRRAEAPCNEGQVNRSPAHTHIPHTDRPRRPHVHRRPWPTQLSFAMAFGSPAGSRSASFEDLLDLGMAVASGSGTSMTPCPRAHQCARDGPTPPTPLLADARRAAPDYAPTRFAPIHCVDPPRHHTCAIDCPAEAARLDSAAGGMQDAPDQGQYTRRCSACAPPHSRRRRAQALPK